MDEWVNEVIKLAEFAKSQLQASYAALTFGLRHRWITGYRRITRPLMPVWISMLEAFRKDRDLHSMTFECVTLM